MSLLESLPARSSGRDILGQGKTPISIKGSFYSDPKYYTDNCPTGVTTQNPELAGRIDIDIGAKRVGTFFQSTAKVLEMYLRAMGLDDIGQLGHEHLIPLTGEAERILHGL